MDLLYRTLGLAAAVNQYLWRHRINFVPLNLVLTGVAAALLVTFSTDWQEAVRNGSTPRAMQVASLDASVRDGTFVRVRGLLAPEAGYTYGEQDSSGNIKKAKMQFVPLVDTDAGRGVFVQASPTRFGKNSVDAQITGMVRPMQEFLERELRPKHFKYAGIQMLPSYVLVADEQPGSVGTSQLWVAITAAYLLVFATLTLKRNVIFRPAPMLADVSLPATGATTLFATGRFHLEKHKKRFIKVPTALGTLDTGDIAAFANVDASSNFMGVTYAKRAGIWVIPIVRGSIEGIEEGTLYFGRRALPSVRFRYRESGTDTTQTAILSASGGSSRALVGALTAASNAHV